MKKMNSPAFSYVKMAVWLFVFVICGHASLSWAAPKGKVTVAVTSVGEEKVDPHRFVGGMEYALAYLVGEGLAKLDLHGKLVPSLAASWKLRDEKTWEFTLRSGVTFHDGTPMTSEDVKFSLERFMKPEMKTAGGAELARYVERVETAGDTGIIIVTKKPDPILPRRLELAGMPISKKYFEKVGDGEFTTHPVAAGPYKFVQQKLANFLEYEAFENYYEGPPAVKTIMMKIVPDAMTRLAMLKTGEADVIDNVTGPAYQEIKASKDMRIISSEAAGTTWICFLDMDQQGSPQADLRVRQALSIAIDRDAIVRKLYFNQAVPMVSMLGPALWGHDRSLQKLPYDPDKAKKLLAEAGLASGFEVALHAYQSSATPLIPEMMEAISSFWAKIGVKAKLDTMEGGVYWGKFREKSMRGLAPLALSENTSDGGQRGVTLAKSGAPYSNIKDSKLDEMLTQQESLMDEKARETLINKIDRYIYEQYYVIPTIYNNCLYGVGKKVQDWKVRYGNSRLEGLERLTLKD